MFSLQNKKALITGATGGIGGSIAKALHAAGASVAISGTKVEKLDALKSELMSPSPLAGEGRDGGAVSDSPSEKLSRPPLPNPLPPGERGLVVPLACDLSNAAEVDALIGKAEAALGGLDILVCNAGVTRDGLFMRMKDEDWSQVLDVNLTSSFKLSRAAVKGMMKQRAGRIIYITSVVGWSGNPGQANYCASKAGLTGMAKSLAQEIASRNVTVNCIAPGFIATAMTDALNDDQKAKINQNIPMGRMGSADEIAAAALYLASEQAAYVTGQTIHVNGGMYMA